jgi:hypothetical protein
MSNHEFKLCSQAARFDVLLQFLYCEAVLPTKGKLMKKRKNRNNKMTNTDRNSAEQTEGVMLLAADDIEATQQKWACSYEAACYIVALEQKIRALQSARADLNRRNVEELVHADAHRHRRGFVRFHSG